MKTNKTTIIILLAAAGLGYYLWTKRRKTAADLGAAAGSAAATAAVNTAGQILTGGGSTGSTSGTGSGTTAGKITFTDAERNSLLSNGKIGNTVKALQLFLKKAGKNIGAAGIDGIFGADTERALNDYEGKKTITLKELNITGYEPTTGTVYGRTFGIHPEGKLIGFEGYLPLFSYTS
jgi:peptidoglycan hydrolase-like protein with peptidoglycan-binding domain